MKDGVTLGYDRSVSGYPRFTIVGTASEGEFNFKITNIR